ncbi:putative reverse transcriptase domain-containing protein [Tanacetum coccineum]
MMNYLKNQGTWKLSQLNNISFEEVKEEFDKLMKQVESFAPINFEATKDSLKRFGEELQTKTSKILKSDEAKEDESTKKTGKKRKQITRKGLHSDKADEDESKDSKDDDPNSRYKIPIIFHVAIIPPSIATYKIIKQGEKGVYQIVREDGTDIVYINFGAMLKDITRDDLTELYRIVMNRYGVNGPSYELGECAKGLTSLEQTTTVVEMVSATMDMHLLWWPKINRNRNNNHHQQQNRRQETARAYVAAPADGRGYAGNLPRCDHFNSYHNGPCPPKCQKCQRTNHQEKDCKARVPGAGVTPLQDVTCYGCGEKGHYKDKCPKGRNQQNEGARGRAYVVVENPQQNLNVVTGTFLFNDHYACILFDSGAEKSFVSSAFTPFIDIAPTALNTSYEVELADEKVVSTNIVLRGSFDVIIGMDWLSYHQAVIDSYEKIVRIPLPNGEILEVQGERPEKDPGSLVCIKADEKKLDDIRVVRDFPEVFPDDLSGLPPVREIEFCIDLIPWALPVVKSPY